MSQADLQEARIPEPLLPRQSKEFPIFRHILACVDSSSFSHAVLAHAAAVATALDARLTVMRVLEAAEGQASAAGQVPADPVAWLLRHRDVEANLKERASQLENIDVDVVVVEGLAAERICAWVRENDVDLTVLGGRGESDWPHGGLGGTARRVVEANSGSTLLVLSAEVGDAPIQYRRMMTPLDGSSRSESALPVALGIAAAHDAEVVLVHAAPNVDLTETNPLEAETISLRDRLRQRNERVAHQYLKQVQSRLPQSSAPTRTMVLESGDPRHSLARAASEDRSDIIVLSCVGFSGHPDQPVGSVADYLINHADMPILLVRGQTHALKNAHQNAEDALAARLPSRALQ